MTKKEPCHSSFDLAQDRAGRANLKICVICEICDKFRVPKTFQND